MALFDAINGKNGKNKNGFMNVVNKEEEKRAAQMYRPFTNDTLNRMWMQKAYEYDKLGSQNALEEAERDVRQFTKDAYESDRLGAADPLGAAQRRLDLTSEQNLFNYKTKGATDYASLKAIWDAEGFKTKSQVEQENRQRAIDAAMAQYSPADIARLSAAGEQDNVLNDWLDENSAMQFAMENPGQVSAYTDFWKNLPAYASAVYNGENNGFENLPKEMQNPWIDFAGTDDAFDILGGMTRFDKISEDQLAQLAEYGQEMAAQYEAAGEIYQPYTTSKFQDHLWEKMIQTPEGAQMWLDEAMGTEEEQAAKDNLWKMERKAKYDALPQAVDFEEKSQAMVKDTGLLSSESDRKYAYINNQGNVRDEVDLALSMTGADNPWYIYTLMEPHEVKKYDYLMREEGEKAAEEYLEYLTYDLDARANKKAAEQTYALAMENGWNAAVLSVASVPMSLARGINYVDVLGQSLFNGDKPVNYERTAGMGVFADAARQGTMDSVNWNVKILGQDRDVFDFLYGTAMSGLDSVAASAMGPVGGPLVLGSSAAQSTMQNALNNGASQGQAVLMGSAAGAFESVFEALSIGKFLKTAKATDLDNPLKWLKNLGVQALTNASEEFNTSVANFLVEQAIMGEKSEMAKKYQYYLDMGLSEKEANAKVAEELAWQFGEDALGGALMGVGMGGISDAAGAVNTRNNDKRVGKAIIAGETEAQILEKAKAFGPDSLSAKSAQKYEKKKTPAGLGKVFRDTLATMDQRGRRELYDLTFGQVKMALNADGEIANVDAVATAIVDLYAGNRLDADEMQALAESKKGMDVAQELLGMDTLTMTALEDAGKAEKKGAAPVGELPKAVQAPEGYAQTETQEAEQEAQEAPEMPAQQSVEVTGADGSTTEIAGIREDDDGNSVIETADGNEIDLEDAGLTESQQQIANEARGTEYAAQTLGAYNEAESMTTNARDFSRGFNRVAAAAANGKTLEEATQGIYAGKISKAAQQAAYAAGQNSRAQMTAQQSSATYKAAQRDGFRMLTADIGSKAGLYYANVTGKVTDAAKTMMRVIGRFAEEAGIQIQVFDTQGKANGAYTQGTNVIRIALDADQGALTKVASHEVYHYIKDWNSDGADRLAKKVFDYLEKADGYNLDQRVQEKIQEYARANVTLSEDAAKEEIVADALLDFIGTEENFRAILSEDSKLADKIRAWVQQMMARIRSILETMAASNPEVRVLKDNEAYFAEIAAMMDGILEETREIMESTKKGESARIKNDPAVTEYREDMRTAKDESERQSALNGLMAEAFMRTQKEWIANHPEADMDSAIAEFREALSAYGRGEKFVQKALEDAGFISPTPGSNEMALLSFAGQQAAMMQERGTKYDIKKEKPITQKDVDALRQIERKSVDQFTSAEIELAEKWARKHYADIGVKSPFFRAWFGDWRAHDTTPVGIASIPKMEGKESLKSQRGNAKNKDTGWEIRISEHGENNTHAHSGKMKLSYYGLAGIRELIENAALLNTEVHEHHDNNPKEDPIAFDHKLYALGKNENGNTALYRITVEEIYEGRNNENSKRFHNLKFIEKIKEIGAAEGLTTGDKIPGAATLSSQTPTSKYNVADLYRFVKEYDKEFHANEKKISPLVMHEDGTPKLFYHGTPNGTFYEFKDWQYFTETKEYADVYQSQGASSNGYKRTADEEKTYPVYLRIENAFDTRKEAEQEIFDDEFFGKWGNGAPLSERGLPDWTDGDDLIEFFEENEYDYDAILLDEGGTGGYGDDVKDRGISFVIKDSGQIKSADENIGTFDSTKRDIRYSLKESPTAPVDEGLKEDAELYTQMRQSAEGKAALKILQKLYGMATRGDTYLMAGEKEALIEKGAWQKRLPEMMEKIKAETGSEINERKLRSDLAAIFNAMDRGEDVSDMLLAAKDLGRDILAEAPGMMNPIDSSVKEAMRILKDSRFYLTDEMKSEIRNTQYGSVAAYMRKNFGKMGIRAKAKDGKGGARKSLAEVWMELNEILPGTFQADATEADMPGIVDAWLETAGQRDFGGAYGQNIGAYSTDLGLSILLEYFNLPGALETANKTKGEIDLEIYRQKKEAREKYESRITELKEKQERMRAEHQQKYEERIATLQAKLEYGKAREDLTKEIQSDVKYLNNRLAKATNTRHVPENMRQIVIKAIKPFLNSTSVFDGKTVSMLREEYEKLATEQVNAETEVARMYNVNVLDSIKNMEKTVDGKLLTDLTLQQLWDVRDVMANIKGMVERANEMFTEGRNENYKALGDEEVIDLTEKETIKNEKVMAVAFKNMTPPYFFKRIGGVFGRMWNDLNEAQGKAAFWWKDAKTFVESMVKKYKVNEWINDKETVRFVTARGETIELNKRLALSIYATWQREIRNKMQDANHLRMGGFTYPKGMKAYEGVNMHKAHALTSVDMLHIQDFLGKNAMEFADEMVGYLSNDMARIGNEVSMQLYNINTFKEKYYFPYNSDSDFLNTDVTRENGGKKDVGSALKNWGATKKLQTKANNAIEIDDFMKVWLGHVNKMCIYGAFTVPVDNINRLLNYKTPVDSDMSAASVKQELRRVYGKGAEEYINTLMRDIGGGVRGENVGLVSKLVGMQKKNAVAQNMQVVVQQFSSIARAMAVMSPKYLAKANLLPRDAIRKMKENSGVALIKEIGRFDTGTGLSTMEWIGESVQDEKWIKRNGRKLDKVTGLMAEKADLYTWGRIWDACQQEIADKMPELRPDTKEFDQEVKRRFEEVVNMTQVYDSVLSRSELMRSKGFWQKSATSFMSEPTVTGNMLIDAILSKDQMGGKRKILRVTSTWMAATALNAILKSLISAARRKDDEERTYLEKYAAEVWGNFLGDMNPLGLIPFGRDIVSKLEGYDVERADMSVITDFTNTFNTVFVKEDVSIETKLKEIAFTVGLITGAPVENIWRDIQGVLNMFASAPLEETSWRDMKYSMLDETPKFFAWEIWDDKATAYYNRMARALDAGDVDKYTEFKEYMTGAEKKTEQSVKTEVIKQIKEMYLDGEMDRESAEKILTEYFEMSEKDAYFKVEEWVAKKDDPDASYSRMGEWIEAVESGENLRQVFEKYKKLGYEKGDLSSAITTEYKPQYIELMKTNPTAAANMKAKLLTALSAIGYDRQEKAKQIDAWLK